VLLLGAEAAIEGSLEILKGKTEDRGLRTED
jgi:hypothetical protein